jgi:multidrug efflux pump
MGGILVATVLTILVLPAAYALFFGREPKRKEEAQSEVAEDVLEELPDNVRHLPLAAE